MMVFSYDGGESDGIDVSIRVFGSGLLFSEGGMLMALVTNSSFCILQAFRKYSYRRKRCQPDV